MWAPQITFGNIFQSQLITSWGKGGQKFNFWFESNTQKMTFSKSMKITLTCDFHFENYVSAPYLNYFLDFGLRHL